MPMHSLRMRIAALVLAFALIAPLLFTVAEAQHDCPGDGCEICFALSIASTITHSGADIPARIALPAPVVSLALLCVVRRSRVFAQTLVGLKVRLDC